MTINYSDGKALEAVLLTRTATTIRAAVEGADDAMEFSNIGGTWVSADCEPVRIEFAWQRQNVKPPVSEADCCCSPELAAQLLHLLFTSSGEDKMEMDASIDSRRYLSASPC